MIFSLRRLTLAVLLLSATGATSSALADKRVALVIGNATYQHAAPLKNPKNDANAISERLGDLGFEVISGTDLTYAAMLGKLRDFAARVEGADVALIFYAGHGLQVDGRNYLAPIDAQLKSEFDLEFEAVRVETVLAQMERFARTNIVLLDACRDNPLARNLARNMGTRSAAIGRGLARVDMGVGTFIAFATQPGNVAEDGQGANSPFTTGLLKHIATPGLDVGLLMRKVRQDVIAATGGRQVPWENSSLTGPFMFKQEQPRPEVQTDPKARLALALVADDPAMAVGVPLHEYGNSNTTYRIERDITFPGDIERFNAVSDGRGPPAIGIVIADTALDRINGGAGIVGRQIALVLDGRTVLSAAEVREPLSRNLMLTGNFSWKDIKRLLDAIEANPSGTR